MKDKLDEDFNTEEEVDDQDEDKMELPQIIDESEDADNQQQ